MIIYNAIINIVAATKPLMWERLKFSERFNFANTSKVVHVVADPSQEDREAAAAQPW